MQVMDLLELFWGVPDDSQSPGYPGTPTANKTLQFPGELNKAVFLSVPEKDVVAGWFNVVCRVTRAGTGFQEFSPLLRVLVKLDPPGGIDPAPDENPSLAAPNLPDEVIRDGVDTSWAARGVPVMIQPYPNMAVGDRIRLNWGGTFVEYTLLDISEVGHPVTLLIDDTTIRAAGDGDAVVLRYQVFDMVNNRSGWSPSTEVVVDVQGDALFLPEVTNADDNGVIDLALLGSDDVRVLVEYKTPHCHARMHRDVGVCTPTCVMSTRHPESLAAAAPICQWPDPSTPSPHCRRNTACCQWHRQCDAQRSWSCYPSARNTTRYAPRRATRSASDS